MGKLHLSKICLNILEESDEEDSELEFWDNWLPSDTESSDFQFSEVEWEPSGNRIPQSRVTLFDFSRAATVLSSIKDPRFGNWIPPLDYLNLSVRDRRNLMDITSPKQLVRNRASLNASGNYEDTQNIQDTSENRMKTCTTSWKKELNFDWGKRIQLQDVTKSSDRELFWGFVDLGIFGKIQLRVNEYGYICCSAGGKISKTGSSEVTYISINYPEILRKMLTISSDQWATLCEIVKETKAVLNFNAFEDYDLHEQSPIEKLWLFLCKRRHFLPRQCMLLKFGGVVKCMTKLEFTPKLLVEDIRYIE